MATGRRHRVLVIIAGEASADLALHWAHQGELPNLQRLAEEGASGSIRTPEPFVTAQMFGTLVTSRDPGEHGLFDFRQRGPDGVFREICGRDFRAPPIWRMANDAGLRSGLINLPFTYPPEVLNGFVLAGTDAPGAHRSIAQPPEIYDELVARFGHYPLKDIYPGGRDKSDYLKLVENDTNRWVEIMSHVAATRDWDLLMCYVGCTAMVQHYFWEDMEQGGEHAPYGEVVRSAFRGVDRLVGRLRTVAGPDTDVFVVSECGAGPLIRGVDVNVFLAQEGFLSFASDRSMSSGTAARRVLGKTRYLFQRHAPPAIKTAILRRLSRAKAWLQNSFDNSGIDWSRTLAFTRGEEGQIFVNLAGRDPHGTVAPGAEYEALCDRIAERLLALRDPDTGEAAVTAVHRGATYYAGPWKDHAPDLVVHWRNGEYMPNETEERGSDVFAQRWREGMSWPTTGSHRSNATFFAAGPSIVAGAQLTHGTIADLVPTWLACLGVRPPAGLSGRVLADILRCDHAEGRRDTMGDVR